MSVWTQVECVDGRPGAQRSRDSQTSTSFVSEQGAQLRAAHSGKNSVLSSVCLCYCSECCIHTCMSVRVCVCVCVRERERMCVWERENVCERESENVFVFFMYVLSRLGSSSRRRIHLLRPRRWAALLGRGSRSATGRESGWSSPPALQMHTEHRPWS